MTEGECCVVFYGTTPEEMMSYIDLNEPPADVCAYCEPGFICRESVQPVFGEGSTFTGTEVNATSRDCVSYNYTQESCTYHWFPCMSNETAQEFPAYPPMCAEDERVDAEGTCVACPPGSVNAPGDDPFLGLETYCESKCNETLYWSNASAGVVADASDAFGTSSSV